MKTKSSFILLIASLLVVGCGAENTALDEKALRSTEDAGKKRYEIMQRAGGNWASLTPEDKKAYVDTFNGDEKSAQRYWEGVKSGPPGGGGAATLAR
jgi:hypothetical protein